MEQQVDPREEMNLRVANRLSTEIFKQGLLLNVTLGYWEGKMQQDEDDVQAQGSDLDREIFMPGFKWLVPKESTRQFLRFRSRLNSTLERQSFKVPGMRGSRFVPKRAYPELRAFLETDKVSFLQHVDAFVALYPSLMQNQVKVFNERYPQYAGQMDKHYPSVERLRAKFYYDWIPYSWSYTDIYDIAHEAKSKLLERSGELIHQSCIEIRQHILTATEAVVGTIKKSTGKVNTKSISAFKERLEQLKKLNLFDDPEITKIIDGSLLAMSSVSTWEKDEVCQSGLEVHLERMAVDLRESIEETIDSSDNLYVVRRAIEIEQEQDELKSEDVGVTRLIRQPRVLPPIDG